MDTYLLLRSNKQSGPYSLQQLVTLGLKPYDLVWLEGRSAAWRYPSEVEGLKAYAPATEEQPYDRFYKKPEEKPQEKVISKPVQPQQEVYVAPKEETYILPKEEVYVLPEESKPVLHEVERTVTTSRKVFVAMPENHVRKKQPQPVIVKTQPIIEEKPVVVEKKPVVLEEKKVELTPIQTEHWSLPKEPVLPKQEPIIKAYPVTLKEEPTLNEKYSESLDDIKRRYTETYLSRKKKSKWTSTHTSVLQVFGGAIVFCLIVVVIYKNFGGEEKPQAKTTMIQPDKRAINTASTTSTIIPQIVPETEKPTNKKARSVKEEIDIPAESLVTNSAQQKKEEVIRNNEEVLASEKKAVMLPKETEETRSNETKPKTKPININRLVNVKANNYKQRAFGGVMNLELTVNNDSKFELDKVIVELVYLKPSEQPIKTETIVFSSIEANGSKTLKIPDYLRGIKVSYRVMEIESSQYEKYTTAGL
ncbi:MAG TPA: hypothetical protein VK492_06555 [Chitinophagaceae bacterium]|nr:hypothetical protein [Chitinophagaceae bacterium]